MQKFFCHFFDFFRAPNQEQLPIKQKFWLYFFFFTTIIFALASGYFVVKLQKMQTVCQSSLESQL